MSWTKRVKHPSKVVSISDTLEAVILDIDTKAKRISLGMKQVEVNPWTLLSDRYPIGSHIRARVRNVTNFGVFVGIEEGIDGLIHVSDLSWSGKIKDPRDVYEKGTEIEAVVLNIDVDNQRFSLGVKQLGRDPWETVESRYPIGQVVEGTVNKILDFGAIVGLEADIEGLVHISEISHEKVESVGKVLDEGQAVRAKVISLIPDERKIGLSIKRLLEHEASAEYQEFMASQPGAAPTLGDLIRDKIDVDSLPDAKVETITVPDFDAHRDEEDESSEMQDPGPIESTEDDDETAGTEAETEAEVEADVEAEASAETEAEVEAEAPEAEAEVEAEAAAVEADADTDADTKDD
jgi:small subunit ribosomal protein S1